MKFIYQLLRAALPVLLLLIYVAVFLFIILMVIAGIVRLYSFVTKH